MLKYFLPLNHIAVGILAHILERVNKSALCIYIVLNKAFLFMKTTSTSLSVVFVCLLITLSLSCKKDLPKAIPTLSTTSASSITSTTATSGGVISNDGNTAITARGVCWSTQQNPTTSDSKTSDGTGTGHFSSSVTGLSSGTTYYIRAYATNIVGTAYGSQLTITTTSILPVLSTTKLSEITHTTATGGGNAINDGGLAITARGVVWSTNSSPSITLSTKTVDGTGIGTFVSKITELSPTTKYFLRAYATNSAGTVYGNEENFITLSTPLSIVGGGHSSNDNYCQFTPKLILPDSEEIIILEIHSEYFTSAPILQTNWRENITMVDDGTNSDKVANDNVYTCRLSKELILKENNSYALNKPFIGRVIFKDGYLSVFAEVWNSNIPEVSVTKLSNNIQRTNRIVNIATESTIRMDKQSDYIKQFYSLFNDNYDYISIIYPGINNNRHYQSLANSNSGIGIPIRNNSSWYGSAGRLRGFLVFPNTLFYDGANVGYQHELGHSWINFLNVPLLKASVPHWPLSDLANSVMGYSNGPGQGLEFPYKFVQQSENRWVLQNRTESPIFNDFDLYLMGLIPPTEVKPYMVFENSNQTIMPGSVITGPVKMVTIDDIINEHGERVPNYQNSPKNFKIATIIISYYPLTQKEMSFYEYYTQRAELTSLVEVREGHSLYLSNPFYLSTRKKGTIDTKL